MSVDPYNETVRERFQNATHAGQIDGGASGYFEDQGLRIRLSAEVQAGTIKAMKFLVWGCPHLIAAADKVCEQFSGGPATALEAFETDQIMNDLAVPVEKTGRILALEDTVRSLGQAIADRY